MTELKLWLGQYLYELEIAVEYEERSNHDGYEFENNAWLEWWNNHHLYRNICGEIFLKRYLITDGGAKAYKRAERIKLKKHKKELKKQEKEKFEPAPFYLDLPF